MIQANLSKLNQRELRKLMLSIRANANRLDLLLAICDDRNLQEDLIQHYEAELSQQGFTPYRTRLELKQPSLKATLAILVAREPKLQAGEKAVVTVLGGSELLGVRLTSEKSEQEKFFFSLQWTREALREFQFPVVVWLSDAVATGVARQAQDFWSWRSGVFEFEAEAENLQMPEPMIDRVAPLQREEVERQIGSIEDLKQQIAELERQNARSPLLITLYNDLGNGYRQEYAHEPALQAYEQALKLAQTLRDLTGQAKALHNLGLTLYDSGRYSQAINFYQQSLEIDRATGDSNGIAVSLGNLGNAYSLLGQYQQAIDSFQQSLEIHRDIGDRKGVAYALGNLGNEYDFLEQYQQAIDFYQQSLEIQRDIGDLNGIAASLGNLGNAYKSLGQHQQAIDFYQQSLEIQRDISDRHGEAASLVNLGNAYSLLGQYQQAVDFHQQSLKIQRDIGDRYGEAASLGNLGNTYGSLEQYERALDFHQQSLEIKRDIGDRDGEANFLFNQGLTLARLDRHYEALQSYQQALAIYEDLKLDHKVEKCKQAIADRNKIIQAERRTAPKIGETKQSDDDDWYTKSLPTQEQYITPHSHRRSVRWWQRSSLWFAVGVAIVLIIWWLRH